MLAIALSLLRALQQFHLTHTVKFPSKLEGWQAKPDGVVESCPVTHLRQSLPSMSSGSAIIKEERDFSRPSNMFINDFYSLYISCSSIPWYSTSNWFTMKILVYA